MKTRRVILELSPSRIDVARFDGTAMAAARRIPITLPVDPDEWARALVEHADALRATVEQLEVSGLGADVLYRSPTQSVLLKSLPVHPVEAREAARLSCFEALPFPVESAICTAVLVAREGSDKKGQSHVIVSADRDDVVAAIEQLIVESGLRFRGAVPMDAMTMSQQVRSFLADGATHAARLYIGEHASFFLVMNEGQIVFARQMRVGLDLLASSLMYPIKRRGGEPIQLDADSARRLLHEHGLPGRDDVVDEALGLTGGQTVPLMQPVLQRLIIELRQSLRFGLSDAQRDQLGIVLSGPGGGLPGFAKLIGNELGVPVEVDAGCVDYDWSKPAASGSQLVDAAADRRLLAQVGLVPVPLARARNTRRLVKWMWTGAAAALVLIGVDATRVRLELDDARGQIDAIEAQITGQELLRESTTRLTTVSAEMTQLERLIASEIGFRPHFGSILKEVSRSTPPNIRLTGIAIRYHAGRTECQINGVAVADGRPGSAGLQAFIDRLRSSPLTLEVALGNVQMGSFDDQSGERFEANFICPVAPVGETEAARLAAAEEQRP